MVSVKLPSSFESAIAAHKLVMCAEAAAYHQDAFRKKAELYHPQMSEWIEAGLKTSAVDYLRAQRIRAEYREELNGLLQEVDAWLTPTAPTPAPEGLSFTGSPIFNLPFTNAGVPSLSVPIGFTPDRGLPLGMQMVARALGEESLLALGNAYQQATTWHTERPQLN